MAMINLQRLGYVTAIAEEGSYAAAATRLGLSQPALSRSIQGLEEEYGIRLFDRGRAGAQLTADGAAFVGIAGRLLNQADTANEQLMALSAGGGSLVAFGLGPVSAAAILPRLLPALLSTGARLRIRVEALNTLQQLLRQGEIDFFISGLPVRDRLSRLPDDFRVRRIPLTSVNLLVRPGHPLLAGDCEPDDLRRYPIAAGSFLRELLPSARLAQLGVAPPIVELDDYATLSALARQSEFIVVAVRGLADVRPDLGLVPLPVDLAVNEVEYGFVSASFNDLSAEARQIATMILDQLASQMGRAKPPPGIPFSNK
ncbi:LysR family transcriptional regulator [Sphingomonadaceae bacterium jetA1]|uniref:LysR family transcriptional regulator n=1 Tax=Facivitalis istanbulensis TaxID=3075838 RepID=UPI00348BADA6